LALIIVTFALFGVDSYMSSDKGGGVVAEVGDVRISSEELAREIQMQRDRMREALGPAFDTAGTETTGFRKEVLDNLIERLEVPQMIVALIQSPNRLAEYAANEQHAQFVVDELMPLLEGEFPLLEGAENRCLMGASFGAVASLHTAWARPGRFGKLFLQSGSFAFADIGDHGRGPVFDPVVRWVQEFREDPRTPADRIQMTCGVYESLIAYNRAMLPVLQGTGADVRLSEDQDGHNWENWRDRLRTGLTWLFPRP
jgi:enterochelin esterase family protein